MDDIQATMYSTIRLLRTKDESFSYNWFLRLSVTSFPMGFMFDIDII